MIINLLLQQLATPWKAIIIIIIITSQLLLLLGTAFGYNWRLLSNTSNKLTFIWYKILFLNCAEHLGSAQEN